MTIQATVDEDAYDPFEALTALATPKSVTTAWPSERSTLSGLMSRWTMPRSCA